MGQEKVDNSLPTQDMFSYLRLFEEDVPEWLQCYSERRKVSFADVLSSRVAYYPGSGFDGTLVRICNKAHAVHSYLNVDYGLSKESLLTHLSEPDSILGYHSIGRLEWKEKDLLPNGQYPINVNKRPRFFEDANTFVDMNEKPYCFTEIMERDTERGDDWGANRFVITFLFADGIAAYYQLFCKEYKMAPWIMLLQDHGFGGNYDCFGKNGILDAIIEKNGVYPEYVLCADNTRIWDGYHCLWNLPAVLGGMHHNPRKLYKRS